MRYYYFGMIWSRLTLAGLALMFSGLVCAELQTGLQLEHDDRVRNYDLFIPSQADGNPRPLVLDLHGAYGNPSHQRNSSGLAEIAGQNNFFAAWPAGFLGIWNGVIGEDGIDDVGFLRKLVGRISSQYAIDPARVYVTGFSLGGFMVHRLACEASDLFAAFAPVAGTILRGSEDGCSPLRPVPVLTWRGENDDLVPYHGNDNVLSAQEVFDFWRVKNDCGSEFDREGLGNDFFCDKARNCGQDTHTRACTVQGAGAGPHLIYNNSVGLDLSLANWHFFASFAHPNPSDGSFTINAGLSDAWFNLATLGQGFFFVVFPDLGQMFVAWFTFDVERPDAGITAILGEPGHRWITAFGPYAGNTATLAMEVTSGGVFNSSDHPVTQDPGGTLTIVFHNCNSATVTFDMPALGLDGDIPVQRLALDNVALCQTLNSQ